MSQYPEHDKLRLIRDKSQAIGEFLSLLGQHGLTLCEFHEKYNEYLPTGITIQKLLAKHFGIDLVKLDDEKRDMLDELRRLNDAEDVIDS
jgi:hypothetical protein